MLFGTLLCRTPTCWPKTKARKTQGGGCGFLCFAMCLMSPRFTPRGPDCGAARTLFAALLHLSFFCCVAALSSITASLSQLTKPLLQGFLDGPSSLLVCASPLRFLLVPPFAVEEEGACKLLLSCSCSSPRLLCPCLSAPAVLSPRRQ